MQGVSEYQYRTPFLVKDASCQPPALVFHNNAWKTANQVAAESGTTPEALAVVGGVVMARPLTDQFPVSTGIEHRSTVMQQQQQGTGGNVFPPSQVLL